MATSFVTAVTSAKSRDKDYKLSDGGGLYLLVRPNRSKLCRLSYAYLGKQRNRAFGPWPKISLADARVRREDAKRLLTNEDDLLAIRGSMRLAHA